MNARQASQWLLALLVACAPPKVETPPPPFVVEPFAKLEIGPGNLAMTPEGRLFISQHQFYNPPQPVVEVKDGKTLPFAEAAQLDSVLGIRADEQGVVWMLDNAMKSRGMRKLVGWRYAENALDRTIDLTSASPDDAFLNDFAVDRTHNAIYIADPASGKNAAIIVVDLATNTARRVLEGHESVIPTDIDLKVDGWAVEIKQPDGKVIRPRVGINPITLDKQDEWLYYGAMHATKLYRVRTKDLRDPAATPRVELYANRPITDGISMDFAGNIYLGDLANNALGVIDTNKKYRELRRSEELAWIDAFSFGPDGYYYIVVNQLHRSATLNKGVDITKPPFQIMRFKPLARGRLGR